MSSYGSIGDCGSGSGSILPGGRPGYNSKGQSNNDNFYRYPAVVTLLSVIDEDPNESDFEVSWYPMSCITMSMAFPRHVRNRPVLYYLGLNKLT